MPSSSEDGLMSQNWSDIITENYSCFWKRLLEHLCFLSIKSCLPKGFKLLLSAVRQVGKTKSGQFSNHPLFLLLCLCVRVHVSLHGVHLVMLAS